MLTLALGESSLLVLDTIESTEIGDSQFPYGAVFLVVVVDMVVVDVQVWLQSAGWQRTQVSVRYALQQLMDSSLNPNRYLSA